MELVSMALGRRTIYYISPAVCAQLQQEERDALTAIYDDLISFDVATQTINARANIAESRDGEEAKEEAKLDQLESFLDAASEPKGEQLDTTQQYQSVTVTVTIKLYPASGPASTRVRFILPPLYPYLRPSFKLLTCEGEMNSADGMMCSTAIQDAMNEIYEKEPMDESEVRVILFDLITAATNSFPSVVSSSTSSPQTDVQKKSTSVVDEGEHDRQRQLEMKRSLAEAEMRHAAAVLAYQSSDHTKLEWSHINQSTSAQQAEWDAQRAEKQRVKKEIHRVLKRIDVEDKDSAISAALALISDGALEEDDVSAASKNYKGIPPHANTFLTILPSPHQLMQYIRLTDQHSFHPKWHDMFHSCNGLFLRMIALSSSIHRFFKRRADYAQSNRSTKIEIGFHCPYGRNMMSLDPNGWMPGTITKIVVADTTVENYFDQGPEGKGQSACRVGQIELA